MDFEKIKTDYKKRYDRECGSIFFAGKNITFFKRGGMSVSGCLSIGEAMAASVRSDGRVCLQFSGSDNMHSFNISEIKGYREHRIARLLADAENCGVKLGGADIFVYKNTQITDLFDALVLGGLSAFCENVPPKERFLPHFQNFYENFAALSGRRGALCVYDGQRTAYIPFFGGEYKIVIAYSHSGTVSGYESAESCMNEAVTALKRGDAEKFGTLLTRETERTIKEEKLAEAGKLFDAASFKEEGTGHGIIGGGSIFSMVKTEKIDSFIHNVTASYRKRYGGAPEFYVTDFADSGIFLGE